VIAAPLRRAEGDSAWAVAFGASHTLQCIIKNCIQSQIFSKKDLYSIFGIATCAAICELTFDFPKN
jgi:hypothetical protein